MFKIDVHVVGDEQVEIPVAIVIDKRTAGAHVGWLWTLQARMLRNIGKCPVSIVPVQDVLPVVRDEDIFEPVVVVISHSDSAGPAASNQACLLGHISERAIAVVLVQAVGCSRHRLSDPDAAENENVEPSIVVVVQESDTAAGGLEDIGFVLDSSVDDRMNEASLRRHIREVSWKR